MPLGPWCSEQTMRGRGRVKMWEWWKINVRSNQTQANLIWQLKSNEGIFVWIACWIMQSPIFCPVLRSIGKLDAVFWVAETAFSELWLMWMSCSARWRENNTRSPVGNVLEGPKHCFHGIVNSKQWKCLIYTVNYCCFVCEWDIIYLLYKWSTFVDLFNVSWLQK